MLHAGGYTATVADLASVPVPEPTSTFQPIPFPRLLEEVNLQLPRFGLKQERLDLALSANQQQMFAIMGVSAAEGTGAPDWSLALGLRSSYDNSLAINMVAGQRVFVCDNLCFNGEAKLNRKQTPMAMRDLPSLIFGLLEQTSSMGKLIEGRTQRLKSAELTDRDANDLMVRSIRAGVLPASRLPKILEHWHEPPQPDFAPRNAWSLYNAYTALHKQLCPASQFDSGLRTSRFFAESLN